ncbi:MAG: hypothetical protein K8L91_17095 [Anaerolineae bacterium]|nr:hypothetical protein [Anaerolineae bacterium]
MRKLICLLVIFIALVPIKAYTIPVALSQQNSTEMVLALAWSPSGEILAAGRINGLWLYNKAGKEIDHLALNMVNSIVWRPDGSQIAVYEFAALKTYILEVPTLEIVNDEIQANGNEIAVPLAWSPDGTLLAVANQDEIVLLDTTIWQQKAILKGHTREIGALEFSLDGSRLASGGLDQTVRIWDVASERQVDLITEFSGYVSDIQWNAENTALVIAGASILIWDLERGEVIAELPFDSYGVWDIDWDNNLLAASVQNLGVLIWNVDTQEIVQTIETDFYNFSICFTPDGKSITYSNEGYLIQTTPIDMD